MVLAVIGLGVALQLSLASFPKWQILVVVSGVAGLLLLIFVPVWQVRNLHAEDTPDMQRRVELENEARKTIAQILGGAAVLAGVFFTAQQLFVAQDAQRIAEEAQITERFTRATEQLGSDELEIRIGGIYAFERIARNSKEDLHPIVSILTTFIRENAPRKETEEEYPSKQLYRDPNGLVVPSVPSDIEAAVQSLISLSTESDNGIGLDLPGANLEGVAFGLVNSRANYNPTYLYKTNLQYASIIGVSMPKADFSDSNLRGATLANANLSGATFQSAKLNYARIGGSPFGYSRTLDLSGASFQDAQLYEADFLDVDLNGANFRGAQLNRVILCGADLRGVKHLTQDQLNATDDGAEVRLPEGLEEPQAWSEADTQLGPRGFCSVVDR